MLCNTIPVGRTSELADQSKSLKNLLSEARCLSCFRIVSLGRTDSESFQNQGQGPHSPNDGSSGTLCYIGIRSLKQFS